MDYYEEMSNYSEFHSDSNDMDWEEDSEFVEEEDNIELPGLFEVGLYENIKGMKGLDAHHVGQKSLMKKFVAGYNEMKGPAINVPPEGHTIAGPNGIVSRSKYGIENAKQLLARDISELRRVYPNIPEESLTKLERLNKTKYKEMRD